MNPCAKVCHGSCKFSQCQDHPKIPVNSVYVGPMSEHLGSLAGSRLKDTLDEL